MQQQHDASNEQPQATPKPLNKIQRRILGVLIEKARTTPDNYPLSLNGLVTGANQKSNRHPLMQLTHETVEDELVVMRQAGMAAEVQGGSRVPKYRHYGYDYLGVRGAEAAVMTELLLRGEQTAGELRTRASRFEPIADLPTLHSILDSLKQKELVVALTPAGRGQVFTHSLYMPEEMEKLRRNFSGDDAPPPTSRAPVSQASDPSRRESPEPSGTREFSADATPARPPAEASQAPISKDEFDEMKEEMCELRLLIEQLTDRIQKLES